MSDELPDDTRPESDEYQDWCERNPGAFDDPDDGLIDPRGEDCCPHCGKPYEEWSDLGCGYCDQRSPDWGLLD